MSSTSGNTLTHDAFLSYCRSDKELAECLVGNLKEQGKEIWWDPNILPASPDWRNDVANAILSSGALIVLVTQNSISSKEVAREAQFADDHGKKLVPIVLEPVTSESGKAGLWLLLCTHNQIRTDKIDSGVANACTKAMAAEFLPVEKEIGVCHHLQPLDLEEDDLPPFGHGLRAVAQACQLAFNRYVLDSEWEKAESLLQDMKHWMIHTHAQAFGAVEAWLHGVRVYDKLLRCKTWNDVADELRKHEEQLLVGVINLRESCPPVAERIEQAWVSVLEEGCEKVCNCMCFGPRDGSYAYAMKHFEVLQAQWRAPVVKLLTGSEPSAEDDPHRLAEQALQAYGPLYGQALSKCSAVVSCRWPPGDGELADLETCWNQCRDQTVSLESFVRYLEGLTPSPRPGSPIQDLTRRLKAVTEEAERLEKLPEFQQLRRDVEAWGRALEALTAADAASAAHYLDDLEQVGNVFAAARDQAGRFRGWLQWQSSPPPDAVDWSRPDSGTDERTRIEQGRQRLTNLLTGVAEPYETHLQQQAAEGAPALARVGQWHEHLKLQRLDLDRMLLVLDLIDLLRSGRVQEAQQWTSSHRDDLGTNAQVWGEICEGFGRVTDVAARLQGAASGGEGLETITAPSALSLEVSELDSTMDQLKKIESHLKETDYPSALCASDLMPALRRLPELISDLREFHRLWARLLRQLSEGDFKGARRNAEQLAGRLPPAERLAGIATTICELEERLAGVIEKCKKAGNWDDAVTALGKLQQGYGDVKRSLPAGFGQDSLISLLETRSAVAQEAIDECDNARQDEEKLAAGLKLIEQGAIKLIEQGETREIREGILKLLEVGSSSPAATPWKRFANALNRLLDAVEGDSSDESGNQPALPPVG